MDESIDKKRIAMLEETVHAFLAAGDHYRRAEASAKRYGEFLSAQTAPKLTGHELIADTFSRLMERIDGLEQAIGSLQAKTSGP